MSVTEEPLAITGARPPVRARKGIGLCLSGGGYRAMLFHVGSLLRLHEAKILTTIDRISSVSGGSITAGMLARAWPALRATPDDRALFDTLVTQPIRMLASRTIDVGAFFKGFWRDDGVSGRIADYYDRLLFGGYQLKDLPADVEFIFCATNLQSAALARFSRDGIKDYRVGHILAGDLLLARAVAASSAFPPVLSPSRIDLWGYRKMPLQGSDLHIWPYIQNLVLTDGGVYDNLGIEPLKAFETILVSDAGGKIAPQGRPASLWLRHLLRVLDIVDDQVRNLRKRTLIADYTARRCMGTYWGIRTDISHYGIADALPCPFDRTASIAAIPTRLAKLSDRDQDRLINWGYAVTDAALRAHIDPGIAPPAGFPYAGGVN